MTIAISGTNGITLDGQFNSASSMGFKNRIINGAMVIDQRNAGASVTFNDETFPVDRFRGHCTQSSKLTAQRSTTAPAVPLYVEPAPNENTNLIPTPLSVSHVPVVSPAIVTVLYSNVFAELIVYVNG